MYTTDIAGQINLGNNILNVYSTVDEPIFKASDIALLLGYSNGNAWTLTQMCEVDEKLNLTLLGPDQNRKTLFVTELGLYNILSQSRMPIARSWRRVVHEQLIKMRKDKMMNVVQQFEEWSKEMNDIYFDEETGALMRSVTLPGGDVEQVPVE